MVRPSFSSLSLKVRHKFSGQLTSKQQIDAKAVRQTDTETSNLHRNNKLTPNQQASSTLLDQTIKMDEVTKTHHPSELLRQVASDMSFRHPEISVTVPGVTSWKTVLHAVDSALGEVDGRIMILDKRSESQQTTPPADFPPNYSAKCKGLVVTCKRTARTSNTHSIRYKISSLSKASIRRDTEAA